MNPKNKNFYMDPATAQYVNKELTKNVYKKQCERPQEELDQNLPSSQTYHHSEEQEYIQPQL